MKLLDTPSYIFQFTPQFLHQIKGLINLHNRKINVEIILDIF